MTGRRRIPPPPTRFGPPSVQPKQAAAAPIRHTPPPMAAIRAPAVAIPPTKFAPAATQAKPAPRFSGLPPPPPRVVQMSSMGEAEVRRYSSRQRVLSTTAIDPIFRALTDEWDDLTSAGTQDSDLEIASKGGHSCAAKGVLDDGTELTGTFDSDSYHAEMSLVAQAAGRTFSSIQIEKEPCPRCAVILNKLGLAGVVTYKKTGQKDYPTWRFPGEDQEDVSWAGVLGVESSIDDAAKRDIMKRFRTTKWW